MLKIGFRNKMKISILKIALSFLMQNHWLTEETSSKPKCSSEDKCSPAPLAKHHILVTKSRRDFLEFCWLGSSSRYADIQSLVSLGVNLERCKSVS